MNTNDATTTLNRTLADLEAQDAEIARLQELADDLPEDARLDPASWLNAMREVEDLTELPPDPGASRLRLLALRA
jgi:hypothetical protein